MIQPQINSLVVAERFDLAVSNMEAQRAAYGSQNELLYHLDFGLVLHFAGRYHESIQAFERAKRIYDQLYTMSASNYASTWLVNDNRAPYRGEDFERVLINVFQSLNFVALGQWEGALVEARDVDAQLRLINSRYTSETKNVYQEDAFARFLMGLVYEAVGTEESLNDAFISYQMAWEVYHSDFYKQYKVETPKILQSRWGNLATVLGWEDRLPENFVGNLKKKSEDPKGESARLIVVHYRGLSPIKHQISIPIPLPNGNIARLAFPKFTERVYPKKDFVIKAVNGQGQVWTSKTELVQNINEIAKQDLNNRQVRVIAKAVFRQAGKQVAIDSIEKLVRSENGKTAGTVAKVAGNFYAYFSEQPDLRSWQTLPAEIRISVLDVSPGQYNVFGNETPIEKDLILKVGETKFLLWRYSK